MEPLRLSSPALLENDALSVDKKARTTAEVKNDFIHLLSRSMENCNTFLLSTIARLLCKDLQPHVIGCLMQN